MADRNAMAKNRDVAFRASMLPIGNYDDGSVAFPVWPQDAVDAYNAMARFHRGEAPQPEDAVLAGLVMGGAGVGGLGARSAGRAVSGRTPAHVEMPHGLPSHSVEAGSVRQTISPEPPAHLPMDPASRAARAREMGFDPETVWYHATPTAGFDEFDISPARRASSNNGFEGVSMAPYPDEGYAAVNLDPPSPGIYPLNARVSNPFRWELDDFADEGADTLLRARQVMPGFQQEGDWIVAQRDPFSRALRDSGFDALDVTKGGKVIERTVLDPRNVRSVNAAFDPAKSDSANILAVNPKEAAPAGALSAGNTMPSNFEQAFAELDAALIDLDGDGVPDVAVPQQSVQQPSNAMAGYAQGGQQPQTNAMAQAARYDNTNFPSGGGLPDYGFGPVTQMSKLGVVPGADGEISNTSRPQEYTAPISEMTPAPIPGGAAIARALPRVAGLAAGGLGLSAMVSDAGQGSESPLQQLYAQQSSLAARRDDAVRARDREGATGKGPRFQAADAEVRRLEAELSGLNAMISDENRRNSPEYQMEMQRKADELAREQKEKEAATPFRERYPEIAGALPYAGYAASLGLPFAAGAKKNIGSFFPGSYAGRVRSAAGRAEAAVAGSDRNAMATSATELGHLIQNQPTTRNAMADAGAAAAAGGVLGAEAGLIPDVIDYSNANLSDEDRAGTLERLGDLQGHALRIGSGALTGWSGYKAGQILTPKRTPDMGRANAMREAADRGSVAPPPQQPQVITRSSAGTYHGPDGRFISPPRRP